MKSTIEIIGLDQEESVHFRIYEMNDSVEKALSLFIDKKTYLLGELAEQTYRIPFLNIIYIEIVDKQAYLYTKSKVYSTRKKLYQLEELLQPYNFLRISKSMLLNSEAIFSISPLLSGRVEVTLFNHERVTVSRNYVPVLKRKLGIGHIRRESIAF